MSKIITCEQVSNGHPDKICDQIADAIVTDILQHDGNARVAIECLLKKSQLFIAGEVTTDYRPNYNQIVHDVFNRIGAEKLGWNLTELLRIGILVDKQSPDIALGVDKGGAGDQGHHVRLRHQRDGRADADPVHGRHQVPAAAEGTSV